MPKCATVATIAKRLQCCQRTITRAMQEGDLLPCSTRPLLFAETDVADFVNDHAKGMSARLPDIPEDLFTVTQVAEALGVKPNTVRKWIRHCDENDIPHFRMSATWIRFRMSDVSNWIKQQTAKLASQKKQRANRIRQAKAYYKNLRPLNRGRKSRRVI